MITNWLEGANNKHWLIPRTPSLHWRSVTNWNVAIQKRALTAAVTLLHRVKICPVTQKITYVSPLCIFVWPLSENRLTDLYSLRCYFQWRSTIGMPMVVLKVAMIPIHLLNGFLTSNSRANAAPVSIQQTLIGTLISRPYIIISSFAVAGGGGTARHSVVESTVLIHSCSLGGILLCRVGYTLCFATHF